MKTSIMAFLAGCLLAPVPLALAQAPDVAATNRPAEAEWLIMVYMAGDNNLDNATLLDVAEMEKVGSSDRLRIVALLDRAADSEWSTARRFLVQPAADLGGRHSWDPGLPTCQDLGEINMGDPQTLKEFVAWARAAYPARKTMLVLWNHGGGWRASLARAAGRAAGPDEAIATPGMDLLARGIAWDDSSDEDFLENREVRAALELFPKLDVLGADACLMAMIEAAYEWRGVATAFVASEDTEPFDGWAYDLFLQPLAAQPDWDGRTLASNIVALCAAYPTNQNLTTLSAVDLGQMPALAQSFDALAGVLMQAAGAGQPLPADAFDVPAFYGFADLDALLEKIAAAPGPGGGIRDAVAQARAGLAQAVLANFARPGKNGRGLTIYPGENAGKKVNPDYRADIIQFARDTRWDEFLAQRAAALVGAATTTPVAAGARVPAAPNRWAVLIGVEKYKDPKVPALQYAVDDIEQLRLALIQQAGFLSNQVITLTDAEATTEKVRSILGTWLPRHAGTQDWVMIFFSGHGGAEPALTGTGGDGTEKYIMLADSQLEDMYGTALPMSEMARIFGRIQADKLLFVMDACYSGAVGAKGVLRPGMKAVGLQDDYLDQLTASQGAVVITASRADEISMESSDLRQGIFSYHLCEVLKGQADANGDQVTTLSEAYAYLNEQVPATARKMGAAQHPVLKGEVTGTFPVAGGRAPVAPAERPTAPPPPPTPEVLPTATTVPPPTPTPLVPPTLQVLTPTVRAGGKIVVVIRNGTGLRQNPHAWIALYRDPAAPPQGYATYTFLNNLINDTWDILVPLPGAYEVRLFPDAGYTPIAISSPITVQK